MLSKKIITSVLLSFLTIQTTTAEPAAGFLLAHAEDLGISLSVAQKLKTLMPL